MIIGPAGLELPGVSPALIRWEQILQIGLGGILARGQLSLDVEPELYKGLKLGTRFLGDPVAKRRGIAPGITIFASGLDHGATAILAAMRRYWPPPEPV